MVIVDSSVWIEYLRGVNHPETAWLDRELQKQPLGLTDLILCEVLQGTRGPAFSRVQAALLKFHVFHSGGIDLAIAAAENYGRLRVSGFTVRSTLDCLIATFCLANKHELLHRDRDFDAFESALGLQVVHA